MQGDYNHLDDLPFSVRQTLARYRDQASLESAQMDADFSSGVRASNSPLTPEFQHRQQQPQQHSLELATIRHPGASTATPSEDYAHIFQQVMSPNVAPGSTGSLAGNQATVFASVAQWNIRFPAEALQSYHIRQPLDETVQDDLKQAVNYVHQLLQERTDMLGRGCEDLFSAVQRLREVAQRSEEALEAHSRVSQGLIRETTDLRGQIAEMQKQLSERPTATTDVNMGHLEWQARIEAHIVNLENRFEEMNRDRLQLQGVQQDMGFLKQHQEQRMSMLEYLGTSGQSQQSQQHDATTSDNLGPTTASHAEVPVIAMTPEATEHVEQPMAQDAELAVAEHEWWGWPAQPQTGSNPFESMPWPTLTTPPELPQEVRAPKLEEATDNQVITADRWKTISQMPTFDPASGNASPWEVGLRYEVWKKQVLTTASAISPSFAEYVKKCFEEGLRRHHEQIQGGRATPLQPIQGFPAEFEARFVMSLLTILPDNIKTPALEGDNASDNIRSVRLIEEILLRVQPGGLEEQSTLMRFVRGLQPAASAKEGLDLIRRWKLAKQRIASLGLPEPACFEQLKGIGVLLGRLEKKHEQLRMRLALLRLNPDVQMGKPGAVETILDNCDQQLRQIAADETSKEGVNSESIIAATKGTSKGLSKEDKKKITCPFLAKPGGCSFGDRCHYSHANQPRPKPKAEPKRGVPPAKSEPTLKKKCIFHARNSGCKKGDACEYLHEGPSGAAQATAGGPGLVGGTASQVDVGTSSASDSNRAKAKAKAKAAAKTAPKVYAAHSIVSSFACMFASRPLRSQGVAVVPQGELWMCEMGPDELIHWMDNPFGVTGFFTSTTDSLLGSAWLAAFDANRFDALADIDTDLGGGNSIIDVSLATAWNQRTSEHDTCFVFIIHTSVGEYLHVALMVAEHRPGCDRPMNELQKRRWDESFVTRHVVEEGSGEQEEIQSVHPSLGDASELSSLSEGTEDTEGSTVSYDSRGFEFGDAFEGFWYLVLSRDEYLEWKRPGTLITRARNAFKPVVGSTSVATGIWRALESVDFSLPLQQLAMGQEQVILEAQTVYVLHADRVFRECVLVWILDMDSGQEQFLILARGVVAPRMERDIRQVAGPPQAAPTWRPPSGGDVSSSSQGFPQVDACISAVNQQGADGILLDSGANEILRQVRVTPKNSTPLPLQLADGQNITAHRTLGGEVVIQGEPGGVNRLIQIGCKFEWAKTGAYLTLPDGTVETLDVRNGLPFMTRRVFQTLRPMMQSWWKKSCCAGVTSQIAKAKNTWMAFDDLVAASVEAPSSRKTNVKHGE